MNRPLQQAIKKAGGKRADTAKGMSLIG